MEVFNVHDIESRRPALHPLKRCRVVENEREVGTQKPYISEVSLVQDVEIG